MFRVALNMVLILVLLILVGIRWVAGVDPSRPNYRIMPEMVQSPAYQAYSSSPVFPDGRTLREPPEGAIPRGHLPLHYEATSEGAARAARELVNPFAGDPEPHLPRGAAVYQAFCQTCHGPGGQGQAEPTRRGVPPPPSLLVENALSLADGHLFHLITYGQGNMAPYASQISREDRWRVILHLRSMQGRLTATQPATETAPASAP